MRKMDEMRDAHRAVGTVLALAAYWQIARGLLARGHALWRARPRSQDNWGRGVRW